MWIGKNRVLKRSNFKASGGIEILIKNDILCNYVPEIMSSNHESVLSVKFTNVNSGENFYIIVCYLPPENSIYGVDPEGFFDCLGDLINQTDHTDLVLIAGDFNARTAQKDDGFGTNRTNCDNKTNSHGCTLIDFVNEEKLCILNGRFGKDSDSYTSCSSRGTAVVDYIITRHEDFQRIDTLIVQQIADLIDTDNCSLIGNNSKTPDHAIVLCKFRTDSDIVVKEVDLEGDESYVQRTKCKEAFENDNVDNILDLCDQFLDLQKSQGDLDLAYDKLVDYYYSFVDEFPVKPNSSNMQKRIKVNKPYWDSELYELWKIMNACEKDFLKDKSHGKGKDRKRLIFKQSKCEFNKLVRKKERIYMTSLCEKIENNCSKNPSEYWKLLNKINRKERVKIPLEVYNENGSVNCNLDEVKNHWKITFEDMYRKSNTNFDESFYKMARTQVEDFLKGGSMLSQSSESIMITLSDVEKCIKSIKEHKACGPDFIPGEMFKNQKSVDLLLTLFQKCYEFNMVPSAWSLAIINPIPKGQHDLRVPSKFRGISLLSAVYKMYSKIINQKLLSQVEHKFVCEQNGFRKNRSCQDQIFSLQSICDMRKNQGKSTFVCLIDYQKCFDYIDRTLLLKCLIDNNVPRSLVLTIKAIYEKTESVIKLRNNVFTNRFEVVNGVRQGCILSTTLMSIFLNSLLIQLKSINKGIDCEEFILSILGYADDLALIAENETDLQAMIDTTDDWCYKWRCRINTEKSHILHVRPKKCAKTKYKFMTKYGEIKIVESCKYLGVIFDEFLTFAEHCDKVYTAASRALSSVISKSKNIKGLGFKSFNSLFDTNVRSIIRYAAGAWGCGKFPKLENIVLRGLRYHLGVGRFTPIPGIVGDCDLFHIRNSINEEFVRLWNRMLDMPNNRINKQIFNFVLKNCKHSTCCKKVNQLLDQVDGDLFVNRVKCNLSTFRDNITIEENDRWDKSVQAKPKLRTYRCIKNVKKLEDYVHNTCITKSQRSLLAKLRMGTLPLAIECGRYQQIPLENRVCQNCTQNKIEDETHFLFECDLYAQDRIKFLTSLNMDTSKILDVLHICFNDKLKLFANYVLRIWKIREINNNRKFVSLCCINSGS